ncbi:hypothetical protein AHMF7605_21525 [Adhaeribacter arboris]|uniref:2'-5' RNA ligase n=1 Tax=Adhaeribacter arboris TaxID=2072846 RepID=A0A2T2YK55_9BACT|nr:2'-5' RNA ligase family protein [Adhaeribacter arboris]PSR55897.1 hypothetical protein AHMF7605_21525 [Adhaeribacter arboris]
MQKADYLLIISPSHAVKSVAIYYKNWLASYIGSFTARFSEPHLSIASFIMDVCKEKILVPTLRRAAAEEKPFSLSTHGFGSFFNSRTVFMQIEEIKEFAQLSRNLHEKSTISFLPSTCKSLFYVPHLTIGRRLEHKYEYACRLFQYQTISQTFTASAVILLKRDEQGLFQSIQEFPFLSRPSQLSLF